jgi:hypothetical protein
MVVKSGTIWVIYILNSAWVLYIPTKLLIMIWSLTPTGMHLLRYQSNSKHTMNCCILIHAKILNMRSFPIVISSFFPFQIATLSKKNKNMAQKLKKKNGGHNKSAFESSNVESLIESASFTKASVLLKNVYILIFFLSIYYLLFFFFSFFFDDEGLNVGLGPDWAASV